MHYFCDTTFFFVRRQSLTTEPVGGELVTELEPEVRQLLADHDRGYDLRGPGTDPWLGHGRMRRSAQGVVTLTAEECHLLLQAAWPDTLPASALRHH